MHTIQVPILGEGIQEARIVTLHKQPGDPVEQDEALCEVETAKAVFPVESSVEGVLHEWLVEEEEEVEVGQKLARIQLISKEVGKNAAPIGSLKTQTSHPGLSIEAREQLQAVVQATVNVDVSWESIRNARRKAKSELGANAPSPSLMVAWAVVQAMKHNKPFTSLLEDEGLRMQPDDFDFGIAVALENDALETAVIEHANKLSFQDFKAAYQSAITTVREGNSTTKVRVPLIISSMGPYHIRSATPVVVPPSIATLFVGTSHLEPIPTDDGVQHQEVVTMDLTFDHRWINGVGAASFMADIRKGVEDFDLPDLS